MTIYVRKLNRREKAQALREGHMPCCNLAHGSNPPDIPFTKNPAALDSLMRKGWAVCGSCFERNFKNGHPRVVIVKNHRFPAFARSRG